MCLSSVGLLTTQPLGGGGVCVLGAGGGGREAKGEGVLSSLRSAVLEEEDWACPGRDLQTLNSPGCQ